MFMKKISVNGWKIYHIPARQFICILGKKVKVYNLKMQCVKTFKEIRYAQHIAFNQTATYMYIGTTENLIYIIDLENLELVKKYQISEKCLPFEKQKNFEINYFVPFDSKNLLLCTAMILGGSSYPNQ